MSGVSAEIFNKYNELKRKRQNCADRISAEQKEMSAIQGQISDCVAAARLFGINLETQENGQARIFKDDTRPTIRDFCLATLKNNFPSSIRAKKIQDAYEKAYAVKLHSKTIGMTLYRLSEDKMAHRDGWDWSYIATPLELKEFGNGGQRDVFS